MAFTGGFVCLYHINNAIMNFHLIMPFHLQLIRFVFDSRLPFRARRASH